MTWITPPLARGLSQQACALGGGEIGGDEHVFRQILRFGPGTGQHRGTEFVHQCHGRGSGTACAGGDDGALAFQRNERNHGAISSRMMKPASMVKA